MELGFEFIWLSVVVGIATFVQACTGFGFALISVPFLSLFIDLKIVVPLTVFYAFLLSTPLSFVMRRDIKKKVVVYLSLGTVPGMFIGIQFLKNIRPEYILLFMGFVLFIYCAYELLKKNGTIISFNSFWTTMVGFFSGILGASVGESGPPVVVYTSCQDWTNDEIKSTMLGFFTIQMAGILLIYYLDGLYQEKTWQFMMYAVPAFLIGGGLGVLTYKLIKSNHDVYHRVVHFILLINGAYIFISNLMKVI